MTTLSPEFESILEKYERAKINTYKVLELIGNDYTFQKFGADVADQHYRTIVNCGTMLTFEKEFTPHGHIYHLTHSNFCRERICPMCQFRKSEKTFAEMLKVTNLLEDRGYRFLHLVLTIPNVQGGVELEKGIKTLYKGFSKFYRKKQVKGAFKGILRCLEISYNYDNDTFHPHLHCLVVVNKSYFNDTKLYLSQDKIRALWTASCGFDESKPLQVFVRAMKHGDRVGVAEVCKYCVKPLELGEHDSKRDIQNISVIMTIAHTLKGTRFLQKYGVVKTAYNELFKDNDDLLDDECTNENEKVTLFWDSSRLKYGG